MSAYYHISAEISGCDLEKARDAMSKHCSARVSHLSVLHDLAVVALDMMFHNNHLGKSADDFAEMYRESLLEAGITSASITVEVWDAETPTDSTVTSWPSGDESGDDPRGDECPGCSAWCDTCWHCGEPRCQSCSPDACWRCGNA